MSSYCILCLDDERIVLNSLRGELMRNFGATYAYEFLDSPFDALEVIDEHQQEGADVIVVISDWLMPQMKGDEFLVKLHGKHPRIIKMLLTGQADEAAIDRAKREANLFKCIQKPWSEKELVSSINEAINSANS